MVSQREKEKQAADEAHSVELEHARKAWEVQAEAHESALRKMRDCVSGLELQLSAVGAEKEREVQGMRRTLDLAIEQLQSSAEDVVDRKLMSNLIIQYHTKKEKKEVLGLLARILNFSEDEKSAVGLGTRRGILSGLIAPLPPPDISAEEVGNSNLVELWVKFLEREETDTRD